MVVIIINNILITKLIKLFIKKYSRNNNMKFKYKKYMNRYT